ncbi:Six-hairpin glycosidase-like protein [Zychaea mexicana]|uniref:Six-hairpin glycosidase-like protein n=1 Tax=Zychaea mexicana TaxID=64656 RepID=UPI0022FF1550|nr:Six-hairpin glycosidase-like protein [Zychaea mexicana]KAI9498696.1 Six-hairpin glycosidase-like protein [Zychaea mexicana]
MSSALEATYAAWRGKYLRSYQDGYYIYYKEPSENVPEMTCSEAHGYGMLVSVLKRNQQDFDGLFRYFMRWRNRKGLMQWQQKNSSSSQFVPGDEGGENCATDGDVDVATSLFLAARVWGRGGAQGEIDYRAAASELAGAVWEHCFNHETFMPLIGDWADPGDDAYLLTRPSDFILSGYLVFYQDDTPRQQQWGNVINAIVNCVNGQLSLNPQTGLIGDFLKMDNNRHYYPARGEVLESEHDGDYNWNSCRVPWRLGHYYMLTRDERVRGVLETQAQFFAHQIGQRGVCANGDCAVRAGYHLNGRSFADYTDMAFVAPVSFLFWVLGWQNQLNDILQDMNAMQERTYFGETIAMLCVIEAAVPF